MLLEKVDQDLIAAMKAGDNTKKDVLRYLKSALKNVLIDSQKETLSDEEVVTIIQREIKRRHESIESYKAAARPELAETEQAEIDVLAEYMPDQMSDEEVEKKVAEYLSANQITIKEMGQAMKDLSADLKGKADLGKVSQILRAKLS